MTATRAGRIAGWVVGAGLLALSCATRLPPPPPLETIRAALRDPAAPYWREPAPKRFFVRFETSKGSFVVQADRKWAPYGVDRLFHLVRAGFFDDSRFFRVSPREFVQFGIPGNPQIAEIWRTAFMPDDPPREFRNERGTVAYAMNGPKSRTTQLFIGLKDHPDYDQKGFLPIARVVSGMSVVDALYAGYGSGDEDQAGRLAPIFEGGNAHLDRLFPRLDKLLSARLVASPEEGAAGTSR